METIKILRGINAQKSSMGLVIERDRAKSCIAVCYKDVKSRLNKDKIRYCNCSGSSDVFKLIVKNNEFGILPHIPLNDERFIIMFCGASKMGKTLIFSELINQFMDFKPKSKIYYFSIGLSKDDPAINRFPLILKKMIDVDKTNDDVYDIDKYNNCLCVFDDIDTCSENKQIMKLIDQITEVGRKRGINILFISHKPTHGVQSTIDAECDIYITNRKNFNNKNRMITHYLQMEVDTEQIDEKDTYVCINKQYSYAITDSKIFKVK